MTAKQSIILITGGNGGLGFELASQLLAQPTNHVLLGSRSAEKGEAAVNELLSRNHPGTVELLHLDVTSEESINVAATTVKRQHGRLDSLVNNAAVAVVPGSLSQQMAQSFATNVTGPHLVLEAFAPLLRKCPVTPRVVNVSSGAGSIAMLTDQPSTGYHMIPVPYRASKAALNMVTVCQAVVYGGQGFKVFAYCPGFTVSNLGPYNTAAQGAKPTSEGTTPMIPILNGERDAEHGKFLHVGGQYPW